MKGVASLLRLRKPSTVDCDHCKARLGNDVESHVVKEKKKIQLSQGRKTKLHSSVAEQQGDEYGESISRCSYNAHCCLSYLICKLLAWVARKGGRSCVEHAEGEAGHARYARGGYATNDEATRYGRSADRVAPHGGRDRSTRGGRNASVLSVVEVVVAGTRRVAYKGGLSLNRRMRVCPYSRMLPVGFGYCFLLSG